MVERLFHDATFALSVFLNLTVDLVNVRFSMGQTLRPAMQIPPPVLAWQFGDIQHGEYEAAHCLRKGFPAAQRTIGQVVVAFLLHAR